MADSALLCTHPVLDHQTIHGIKCSAVSKIEDGNQDVFVCLIWGGRSISLVNLQVQEASAHRVNFVTVLRECWIDDWILDACFSPSSAWSSALAQLFPQAVVVTDHNQLLSLHVSHYSDPNYPFKAIISTLSTGPSSVLYSAHIVWPNLEQVIVAAGTAFGDVLVWDCCPGYGDRLVEDARRNLIRSFSGHEGSVFGVKILRLALEQDSESCLIFVASCSDDRTIRLWSMVDDLDVDHPGRQLKDIAISAHNGFGGVSPYKGSLEGRCIANVMSHLSRIWDIKFLNPSRSSQILLSFGEDATARLWRLEQQPIGDTRSRHSGKTPQHYRLQEQTMMTFHIGKNIWASATCLLEDGRYLLSTGGADGTIIVHTLTGDLPPRRQFIESIDNTFKKSIEPASAYSKSTTKNIFDGLQGTWGLRRQVNSRLQSSPSGEFEGRAQLTPRSPSDPSYDAESLYVEEGQFRTDNNLIFKARRRYVYRYRASSQSISAWFVKVDETTVDYLFHELKVTEVPSSGLKENVVIASGSHLCIDDNYFANYKFDFKENSLGSWSLSYHVKGPSKDYVSDAMYTRLRDDETTFLFGTERFVEAKVASTTGSNDDLMDSFKAYCWIDKKNFIATTAVGRVLIATLENKLPEAASSVNETSNGARNMTWSTIGQFKELQSHSVLCSLPGRLSILGGTKGLLFIYLVSQKIIKPLVQLPRKVATLSVHQRLGQNDSANENVVVLATCLGLQDAFCICFNLETVGKQHDEYVPIQHSLCLSKSFIVTSSGFVSSDLLLLGSRYGSICVYDLAKCSSDSTFSPLLHVSHVHGNDAVTRITRLPSRGHLSSGTYFITIGRDGRFAAHCIREERSGSYSVDTVHNSELPFGPNIEGASIDPVTSDLLIWGFRSKEFVVWNNTKQKEVMKVECRGAHRSFAFLPHHDGRDGGSLVWIQASSCHIVSQDEASHLVTQSGSHGREMKAMAVRPESSDSVGTIVATGAEDTTIRMSRYNDGNSGASSGFQCLAVMYKHVTGPQVLRWSSDGRYLFSAGGREEFYIWMVQAVPYSEIGVLCIGECPPVTESRDLRIMDFDVIDNSEVDDADEPQYLISIAYSDSTVRVSSFNSNSTTAIFTNSMLIALALFSQIPSSSACSASLRHLHDLLPDVLPLPISCFEPIPPYY